jgi:hypothetical protein
MTLTIDFGCTKQEIISQAESNKCKYVLIWHDHYYANSGFYWKSISDFANIPYFHWNTLPEDRGAIKVIITDVDIENLYQLGKKIENEILTLYYSKQNTHSKAVQRYGIEKTIDGRWSIKNPKYIEVKTHNNKIRTYCKRINNKINKQINQLMIQLKDYLFVDDILLPNYDTRIYYLLNS